MNFTKELIMGIFGYTDPLDEYFDAMNHWFSTRYGYTIEPKWVTLGAGIVYALGTSVKAFTEEGDAMMVMQPVYYPFSEVIKNDGRKLVNCQLRYENNRYSIDFEKNGTDDQRRKCKSADLLQSTQSSRKSLDKRRNGKSRRNLFKIQRSLDG